jgi:hypothetical protein
MLLSVCKTQENQLNKTFSEEKILCNHYVFYFVKTLPFARI